MILPVCLANQNENGTESEDNSQKIKLNDDYHFFPFAIIWGKYEKLIRTGIFGSLYIENPSPYNPTMHVIGYVDYEHRFIHRRAAVITCPCWFGFLGRDSLCIIAWGASVTVW